MYLKASADVKISPLLEKSGGGMRLWITKRTIMQCPYLPCTMLNPPFCSFVPSRLQHCMWGRGGRCRYRILEDILVFKTKQTYFNVLFHTEMNTALFVCKCLLMLGFIGECAITKDIKIIVLEDWLLS